MSHCPLVFNVTQEQNLADLIISVIEELGPRKMFGVVIDNAKNIKKAWVIISKSILVLPLMDVLHMVLIY